MINTLVQIVEWLQQILTKKEEKLKQELRQQNDFWLGDFIELKSLTIQC